VRRKLEYPYFPEAFTDLNFYLLQNVVLSAGQMFSPPPPSSSSSSSSRL
jgi:hypothetical protein